MLETAMRKSDSVIDTNVKQKSELPHLELIKFSPEPKNYLAFCSQFEKIHMDPEMKTSFSI